MKRTIILISTALLSTGAFAAENPKETTAPAQENNATVDSKEESKSDFMLKPEFRSAGRGKSSGDAKSFITLGAGYSLVGGLMSAFFSTSAGYSSLPVLGVNYDYRVAEHFSIGLGYTYQSFSFKFPGYTTYNTSGNPINVSEYTETITRQNIAIRPLFHFGSDDLDLYAGARLGYTIWGISSTNTDPSYVAASYASSGFSPQALFGMSYYFTDNIGVMTEIGIGAPFAVFLGANIKF